MIWNGLPPILRGFDSALYESKEEPVTITAIELRHHVLFADHAGLTCFRRARLPSGFDPFVNIAVGEAPIAGRPFRHSRRPRLELRFARRDVFPSLLRVADAEAEQKRF